MIEPQVSSQAPVTPPDESAERAIMLADVIEGLSLPQKELSPKYFYDQYGSELFEEITRLEEYYPTRTERALLERCIPDWVADSRPEAFIELGAGSAVKSRIVLDAMVDQGTGDLFVPLDVSADFLHETAHKLRDEYDGLRVEPEVADMTQPLELSIDPPSPAWYGLLGGTLGNFDPAHAVRLLCRVGRRMRPDDRFLLGVDQRPGAHKTVERLELAYNDERGVTAEFNLNVLNVLNRELGADFDPSAFRHHAFYEPEHGRIEMHLISERAQTVVIPDGGVVHLDAGETIRTEISSKYDRASLDTLLSEAGLVVDRWEEDAQGFFALVLLRRS